MWNEAAILYFMLLSWYFFRWTWKIMKEFKDLYHDILGHAQILCQGNNFFQIFIPHLLPPILLSFIPVVPVLLLLFSPIFLSHSFVCPFYHHPSPASFLYQLFSETVYVNALRTCCYRKTVVKRHQPCYILYYFSVFHGGHALFMCKHVYT